MQTRRTPRSQRFLSTAAVAAAAFGVLFAGSAHASPVWIGFVGAADLGQITAGEEVTMTVFDTESTREEPFAPGWEVGGVVEWPRSGRVRLESGARYLVQPGVAEVSTQSPYFFAEDKLETRLEYAVVPIQVLVSPLRSHRLRISGGVNVGYLLRASSRFDGSTWVSSSPAQSLAFATIFENIPFGQWTETTGSFQRWNTEVSAGAGWEFGGEHPALRFDLRYAYGLNNVSDDGLFELRTRRVSFSVATLW